MKNSICVAVALLSSLAGKAFAQVVVNGDLLDWGAVPVLATDPSGDASGAFDITQVKAVGEGSVLYIQFDTTSVRNLAAGDAGDGNILMLVGLPGGNTLEIDFRGRQASFNGGSIGWNDIGWVSLPTYAANVFECRIDSSSYGLSAGDTVTIQFSDSDSLSSPALLTMGAAVNPAHASTDRLAQTTLRIASINTLRTGLLNGSQSPGLERLIDSMNADVYCFQEEYNSSAGDIQSLLNALDPTDDGSSWNVIKTGSDEVLASKFPLISVPNLNPTYVAGVVDMGVNGSVLVLSIHPKCCGYIGTTEDGKRINEHTDMATTIADLRAGNLGGTLASHANAGVVVIGDWNLVGSRTPLDIMLDPAGPDLTHLILPDLVGADGATWHDPDGFGFPPGMLDLCTYSASTLTARNNFLLDSQRLTPAELSALGIQSSDSSNASDHLMLVADFLIGTLQAPNCLPDVTTTNTNPGDPNYGVPDGAVNGGDLSYFVEIWLVGAAAADLTTTNANPGDPGYGASDGATNGADLSFFVEAWLAGCP